MLITLLTRFLEKVGRSVAETQRTLDLNFIRSCFIDHKNYGDIDLLLDLINKNAKEKCWLVFSTHDVGDVISPFGCPKDVFEEIVARSVESKSLILPIRDVCSLIAKQCRRD